MEDGILFIFCVVYVDSILEMVYATGARGFEIHGSCQHRHTESKEGPLSWVLAIVMPVYCFSLAPFLSALAHWPPFCPKYTDSVLPHGCHTCHSSAGKLFLRPPQGKLPSPFRTSPPFTHITTTPSPLLYADSFVVGRVVWVALIKIKLPCVLPGSVLNISLPCRMWIPSRQNSDHRLLSRVGIIMPKRSWVMCIFVQMNSVESKWKNLKGNELNYQKVDIFLAWSEGSLRETKMLKLSVWHELPWACN